MNAPVQLVPTIRAIDFSDSAEVRRVEGFVAERGGSVFQRPLWLSTTAHGTGNSPLGLVLERGGVLDAWLPLTLVSSALFGRALVSSGFGVGGGMLVSRRTDIALLGAAATELAARNSISSIGLRDPHDPDD